METNELPALAPLTEQLTAEQKRDRQRLHVKRTYYRKLQGLQGLREEMLHLERQYAQLSQHQTQAHTVHGSNASKGLGSSTVQAKYAELSAHRLRLIQQNADMRAAIDEHERFRSKINTWIENERALLSPEDAKRLRFPTLRAPVSVDVCRDLARRTYEEMRHFRENRSWVSTGVSVFGWRDRRVCEDGLVKFSLKKVYPHMSAEALSLRGWAVVASSARLSKLYTSTIKLQIYPMQHVDEDNVLMCRIITSPDGTSIVKTFFLVSRFATPEGFVLVSRSMDRSYLNDDQPTRPGVIEHWRDIYVWNTCERGFDEDGSPVCNYEFGGEVRTTPFMDANMWMLEVLLIALRWDSVVVGSIISLAQ